MPPWLFDIIYPLSRWIHIVSMTLIVGGTLFFELVLPLSIDDLKREQQLFVFARARLVFRWVVWIGAAGLLLSGALSLYRMRLLYSSDEFVIVVRWTIAHIALGMIGLVIALLLTIGRRPPEDPVRWMRLNLVILLVTIFLGSATRHFQLALNERQEAIRRDGKLPPEVVQPATQPASRHAVTAPANGEN
jgi:uncharacterized membrane protein